MEIGQKQNNPHLIKQSKLKPFFNIALFLPQNSLILLEGDAFVEFLVTFVAFGQEVEADTTDVLLGTEVL